MNYHIIKEQNCNVLYQPNSMSFYRLPENVDENLIPKLSNQLIDKEATSIAPINSRKCTRLVLVVSQKCNLQCKYCYAEGGDYGQNDKSMMNSSTAISSIEYFLSYFPDGIGTLQFFGGEPLLNIDLIEEVCAWVYDNFKNRGIELPKFAIVTNATLIDERAINLFNKYNFVVTLSLDGDKDINDYHRVFNSGTGSVHDKAFEAIKIMNKKRNFSLNIQMTVTSKHMDQFERDGYTARLIEYFNSLGVDTVHSLPVSLPSDDPLNVCNAHNKLETVRKFYETFSEYSINSIRTKNPIYMSKLLEAGNLLRNHQKKVNFCNAGICDFSVNTTGDVYPCFMFIGHEEYLMGNIDSIDIGKFNQIRNQLAENLMNKNESCKNCWANGLCGNCVGSSYLMNKDINKPAQELCETQKVMLEKLVVGLCNMKDAHK